MMCMCVYLHTCIFSDKKIQIDYYNLCKYNLRLGSLVSGTASQCM